MESDKPENEAELTSTMGNLMATNKDEKTDTSDSTPTSSTDASTTTSTHAIVTDDPISSTSEVFPPKKMPEQAPVNVENTSNVMTASSSIVSEKDLLVMNITDTSTEKITEDVEDIVQDLENLLGEPSIDYTIKSKDVVKLSDVKTDSPANIEEYSKELERLDEKCVSKSPAPVEKENVESGDATEPALTETVETAEIELQKQETKMEVADEELHDTKEVESAVKNATEEEETNNESLPLENEEKVEEIPLSLVSNECNATAELEQIPDSQETDKQMLLECNLSTNKDTNLEVDTNETVEKARPEEAEPDLGPKVVVGEETESVPVTEAMEVQETEVVVEKTQEEIQRVEPVIEEPEVTAEKVEESSAVVESTMSEQITVVEKTSKDDEVINETANDVTEAPVVEEPEDVNKATKDVIIEEPEGTNGTAIQEPEDETVETPAESSEVDQVKEEVTEAIAETCDVVESVDPVTITTVSENVTEAADDLVKCGDDQVKITPAAEDVSEAIAETSVDDKVKIITAAEDVSEAIAERSGDDKVKISTAAEDVSEAIAETSGDLVESRDDQVKITKAAEDVSEAIAETSGDLVESRDDQVKITTAVEDVSEAIAETSGDLVESGDGQVKITTAAEHISEAIAETSRDDQVKISTDTEDVSEAVAETSGDLVESGVDQVKISTATEDVSEAIAETSGDNQVKITAASDDAAEAIAEASGDLEKPGNCQIKPLSTSEAIGEASVGDFVESGDNQAEIMSTSEAFCEARGDFMENSEAAPVEDALTIKEDSQEVLDAVLSLENIEPVQSLDDLNSLVPEISSIAEAESSLPIENQEMCDNYVEVPNLEAAIAPISMEAESTPVLDTSPILGISSDQTLTEIIQNDQSFAEQSAPEDLPTVDEIFAEPDATLEQPIELQDENFETLLAVASLQPDTNFDIPDTDKLEEVIKNVAQQVQAQQSQYMQQEITNEIEKESSIDDVQSSGLKESEFENPPDDIVVPIVQEKEVLQAVEVSQSCIEEKNEVTEKLFEETKELSSDSSEEEQGKQNLKEPLIINIDDTEKEKPYSPKITIKPIRHSEDELIALAAEHDEKESCKGSLKMTITKQDNTMHSILKIYDPEHDQQQENVPKLIIKPIVQQNDQQHSPKVSTRSSKVFSPSSSSSQRSSSPRITIKPIVKPDSNESVSPLKITIKPVLKPEERQKHSPKLTIKPIVKPDDEGHVETKVHSPRVTIKPIVKPPEEEQQSPNPRITIKPIPKPVEEVTTPRLTIKPVVKPHEKEKCDEEKSSPKITIKTILKPQESEGQAEEFEESNKGRIVLKINKGNSTISNKEEKSEKLAKIKLKFSKEGGHPHIVQEDSSNSQFKRSVDQSDYDRLSKRLKSDDDNICNISVTPISPSHSKLKEMLSAANKSSSDKIVTIDDHDHDVKIVENVSKQSPIVISEESNQDSTLHGNDGIDPLSEIPVFEVTPEGVKQLNPQPPVEVAVVAPPAPRKRGRPRKVPLQVREDFKDTKEEEPKPVVESTRPKRSCRGQSVRTTLGIKPRKPRGPGRGRGSKRGMGTRVAAVTSPVETRDPTPPPTPPKAAKEPRLSAARLKQMKEELSAAAQSAKCDSRTLDVEDGVSKSPGVSVLAPPQVAETSSTADRADIVMYEEETRMSAETSSRAQTPAKQVVTSSISAVDLIDESQSSVQSSATTESVKVRKGPRLEVHQEPEGAVISADQLAEYYWGGSGPYMLQEQVAQFLGIKSFKRKYPNIPRRVVDMQERDFIRESGLAGEAMCDLGLTAVNSADILDIMYSDFQDKYEEYCKHQRDRQAKDLTNKQKALSLAASQEKTKMDITQQAVQSAASWNANFNKTRRDQRKACMDLQTLTVHFPKGKMKQINKPKIGNYPVSVVPGQYTDYYNEFTPTEINNLPLNTLCYDAVIRTSTQEMDVDSQTDGSASDSESSTSDSDSSFSGSSDGEDCTLCNKTNMKRVAAAQ